MLNDIVVTKSQKECMVRNTMKLLDSRVGVSNLLNIVCKIYTRVELTNDACGGNIDLLYIIGVCAFHTATSPAAARIP